MKWRKYFASQISLTYLECRLLFKVGLYIDLLSKMKEFDKLKLKESINMVKMKNTIR